MCFIHGRDGWLHDRDTETRYGRVSAMRNLKSTMLRTTGLSTVALLALGVPDLAAAEKISLKVGGYMEQFVGYTSQDSLDSGDFTGADIKSDTEIWFTGKTTLDNGIKIGVNVQLEGNTSSDQIDESYLTIDGGFGRLVVGGENSAMYILHTKPKDFGFGLNSGDNVEWSTFDGIGGNTGVFRGPFGSTAVEPGRVNDVNRLTYFTPKMAGFQFAATYVPDSLEDDNTGPNRDTELHDGATFAVQYGGKLGAAKVSASAGYGFIQAGDKTSSADPTSVNFGLSVGVGDWTLAGAAAFANDDTSTGDMSGITFGLNYTPGPWKAALHVYLAERDGSVSGNAGGTGARQANFDTVQLETSYALGPGISVVGVLGYAKIEDKTAFGDDSESAYGVAMMRLGF